MPCEPYWTEYLSALLVPVVAIFGLFIAYRQWKTAQNKLKLELFERRLAIYNSATTFISSVMTSGKATDEQLRNLIVGTKEAKWVLSYEIAEHLDKELYSKGVDLQCLSAELEGEPVGEMRTKNVHEQRNIKQWLNKQYETLDSLFRDYLQLRH